MIDLIAIVNCCATHCTATLFSGQCSLPDSGKYAFIFQDQLSYLNSYKYAWLVLAVAF